MRVRIDIDPEAVPTTTSETAAPSAGPASGGGATNGGPPSAELLAAVAAAGGLTIESPGQVSVSVTNGLPVETLDGGLAPPG